MNSIVVAIMVFIAPNGQAVGGRTMGTMPSLAECMTAAANFGTQDAGNGDGVVAIVTCGVVAAGEPA